MAVGAAIPGITAWPHRSRLTDTPYTGKFLDLFNHLTTFFLTKIFAAPKSYSAWPQASFGK